MAVKNFPIVGCLLTLLIVVGGCSYYSNFTDRGLEERFRVHETDFQRLVQMMREDSEFSSVTHHAVYRAYDIKVTPPSNRFDDYRRLLSKLDLASVSRADGTDRIYFAVWNKADFFMGGTNEYFVYAETPPADAQYLVESLDKLRGQTDAFAFKKFSDRWYLHVDNW
jgi:hypothetical protein